jgi:hypothetical protein
MAIYAGETVRILANVDDWDGTPMSPASVEGVSVFISNKYGDTLVEGGEMEWVPQEAQWQYSWNTPDEGGVYSVEVIFAASDGTSVDVRKVTLSSPRSTKKKSPDYFVRERDVF